MVRRYHENVIQNPDGCWGWKRPVQPRPGYAMLGSGHNARVCMHRLSYEIHIGPIPDGEHVLHHCDNKICTRPDHLFLGSNDDNAADARDKGLRVKPTCRRGHEKTPENTYVRVDRRGYVERHCKRCSANYRT